MILDFCFVLFCFDKQLKVKVKLLSHVQLFATPWTVTYQAPLTMGFSRQEYWSGLPLPSPLPPLKSENEVTQSCLTLCKRAIRDVIDWLPAVPSESRIWGVTPGEFHSVLCLVAHSCLTLCDLTDYSPPGSSVREILQARIQEWVVMPSSRGSAQPRDRTQVSGIAGGFFTIWASRKAQEYWSK